MNKLLKEVLDNKVARSTIIANIHTKKLASWFSVSREEAVNIANEYGFKDIKTPDRTLKYNSYFFKLEGGLHCNNDGTFDIYIFHD